MIYADRAERLLRESLIEPDDLVEFQRLAYLNDQMGDAAGLGVLFILALLVGFAVYKYWEHENKRIDNKK